MAESPWLSLKVVERQPPVPSPKSKPEVFVSVPKKILRLATERNRLKRLIREAVRLDDTFKDPTKTYRFRLVSRPLTLNLKSVQTEIRQLT